MRVVRRIMEYMQYTHIDEDGDVFPNKKKMLFLNLAI